MKNTSKTVSLLAAIAIAALAAGVDSAAQGRGGGGGNAQATAASPVALGPVTGSAANGRRIYYEQSCYGCHGFNGETGARDLVGTNSPVLANEENFVRYLRLRADVAPLLPSTRMPNYRESEIGNADASDLYAFIRSFRLSAPDIEDVPTLQQILESAERPYVP